MKVLVLAGGYDQIELIKKIKTRGHYVYLADYYENPPAKEYADRHIRVSTLDEDAIKSIVSEENIELITTACTDQALMTVASVSEQLGLPCYISKEKALNVTNKAYMKKRFIEYDIPTAKCIILEDEKWDAGCITELRFPLIVKPCDCNSSKGVVKVSNVDELTRAVEHAFTLSRSRKAIIEEFIEGNEISIDVWKDKEGVKVLSISETNKIQENSDNFTIYQSVYPPRLSPMLIPVIQDTAEKIYKAFDLEDGPVLIQAITTEDSLNVVEFSARMGGGTKYKLIEYISGIDIMDKYVDYVLENKAQTLNPQWTEDKIELDYVYVYPGTYDRYVGFQEYVLEGKIKELFEYKKSGSKIETRITSGDRVLGILLLEKSEEELLKVRNEIMENVDILDDQGCGIMYKVCYASCE